MKLEQNWRSKSVTVLENSDYGDPETAPTPLVKRCLEYVRIPVGNLDIEQLRLLIGQQIGLPYLIVQALTHLEKDILSEGDFYPGDLLKSIISVDVLFWKAHSDLYRQLKTLIKKNKQKIAGEGINITSFLNYQ
ncbi:hypothetical protein HQ865_03300 [Mucilaginibacter mali]|uniref:Uncharacterized protein n=1 Tax=Mucilaginibacter mali TaxID=2740462 RepID=A0A7D4Q8F2_9SPHI|nr:contact-dependent growth inhibition system immunity protein [Mucilaginibacter mali]QKJ28824.1 hypothetical protein HQ865_03300 [Mucilaginibacter mali]